jgi:energy-coupling factor transporter transmembrane protein EcfT
LFILKLSVIRLLKPKLSSDMWMIALESSCHIANAMLQAGFRPQRKKTKYVLKMLLQEIYRLAYSPHLKGILP